MWGWVGLKPMLKVRETKMLKVYGWVCGVALNQMLKVKVLNQMLKVGVSKSDFSLYNFYHLISENEYFLYLLSDCKYFCFVFKYPFFYCSLVFIFWNETFSANKTDVKVLETNITHHPIK